jgi:hypothetical protein
MPKRYATETAGGTSPSCKVMAQKVEPQISEAMANRSGEDIAKVYEFSQFLVGMAPKRQSCDACLSPHKRRPERFFRSGAGRYDVYSIMQGPTMNRSLNIKIAFVLGYVALCTMLVVADQQADAPSPKGQLQAIDVFR